MRCLCPRLIAFGYLYMYCYILFSMSSVLTILASFQYLLLLLPEILPHSPYFFFGSSKAPLYLSVTRGLRHAKTPGRSLQGQLGKHLLRPAQAAGQGKKHRTSCTAGCVLVTAHQAPPAGLAGPYGLEPTVSPNHLGGKLEL